MVGGGRSYWSGVPSSCLGVSGTTIAVELWTAHNVGSYAGSFGLLVTVESSRYSLRVINIRVRAAPISARSTHRASLGSFVFW